TGSPSMISMNFKEGQCAARRVLQALSWCLPDTERSQLLAEAMGDVTDVVLGSDNLAPTQERVAGIADVMARFVPGGKPSDASWQASQLSGRASRGSVAAKGTEGAI